MRAAAVIVAFLGSLAAVSPQDADYLWDHPEEVVVLDRNIAFSHQRYRSGKSESIFLMGYFNDGWVFMFSLFHVDAKVVDRWGMYALIAAPDGTSYWRSVTFGGRNLTFSEDRFFYSDGANTIENSDNQVTLSLDFDGFVGDLVFEKYLPAWKPGTGIENYTDDGENFQYKAVFAPWAHLRGTIKIDGMELDVDGQGYGEKTLFVNSLTRHQPYLHALRLYTPSELPREDSWHIGILQATLNKAYGLRELPRIVLAKDDKWLFTTRNYTFEALTYRLPDFSTYKYPTSFRLHAEKNGYVVDGIVSERVFFHFTDIFASLPKWVSGILTIFFKRPVYYRYIADFNGTITDPDGTVRSMEMSGPYEYVVVF